MHLAREDRVEGMHVEDRLDVPAIVSQLDNLLLDRIAQRVGVEKDEFAVASPHQRRLRANIDDTTELERPSDVPKVVCDVDDVWTHGPCRGTTSSQSAISSIST